MTRYIQRVFLKGLIAIIPVAVTIYLVIWLASGFEAMFGSAIEYLLPTGSYVPGMGLVMGVLLIFFVGLMLQTWFTRQLWELGEKLLDRMPLVRPVFGSLKQVVAYMSGAEQPKGNRVVMVSLGDPPLRMLGLVTQERLEFLAKNEVDETVAVFLPWSYQIGGFTVFLPRSALVRVDLTPQEALRLALTAGVTSQLQTASKR
jgi:uncharacterized membrane protein